jgi:ferredoxin
MATVITDDCINCAACEPECPNTAIYEGGVEYQHEGSAHQALSEDFFYIIPDRCSECVGFFDEEACAVVCPVDCCIPDPDRPETEVQLIERARVLHPDENFGDSFPSRFSDDAGGADAGEPAAEAGSTATESAAAASPVPAPATPAPAAAVTAPEAEVSSVLDFPVPVLCRSCEGEYEVDFRFLTPGTVLRCPLCQASFSPGQRVFLEISRRLDRYADLMNAEVDRHESAVKGEVESHEANIADLKKASADELRRIVESLLERPRRSMFG